jgi:hypothetical protein
MRMLTTDKLTSLWILNRILTFPFIWTENLSSNKRKYQHIWITQQRIKSIFSSLFWCFSCFVRENQSTARHFVSLQPSLWKSCAQFIRLPSKLFSEWTAEHRYLHWLNVALFSLSGIFWKIAKSPEKDHWHAESEKALRKTMCSEQDFHALVPWPTYLWGMSSIGVRIRISCASMPLNHQLSGTKSPQDVDANGTTSSNILMEGSDNLKAKFSWPYPAKKEISLDPDMICLLLLCA